MGETSQELQEKIQKAWDKEIIKRSIEGMDHPQVALNLQYTMLIALLGRRKDIANGYAEMLYELNLETKGAYIANPEALSKRVSSAALWARGEPYTLEDYNNNVKLT